MVLGPDAIGARQFSSSLRGFDKDEVRSFLRRVAADYATLQAELTTANEAATVVEETTADVGPADVDDAAAVVPAPVPAAVVPPERVVEPVVEPRDDQFEALGERIAELLRSAHDSASRLREAAEAEADVIRREAEADAARMLAEADENRQHAIVAATAELDSREQNLEVLESAAEHDREQAMVELANARDQVNDLLEQARNQSDFIRHEAEEIIRGRVRDNVDQAEQRLNVLRNTEIASRERIAAVYRELETALARLDAESVPALPEDPERAVLEEAQARAAEVDYPGTNGDTVGSPEIADDDDAGQGDVIEAEVVADELIDADLVDERESDLAGLDADQFGQGAIDDVVDAELIEQADGPDDESLDLDSALDQPGEGRSGDAESVAAAEERAGEGEEGDDDGAAPENEDALARLVREAMQKAVESAREIDD